MSLFPVHDRAIMEAIRQLTMEESLSLLHDLAYSLMHDRLRDYGPGRAAGRGDDLPMRPGWHSLGALEHALRSANLSTSGIAGTADLVEAFGEEDAAEMEYVKQKVLTYMFKVGEVMETTGCSREEASIIAEMQLNKDTEPVPDDLDGFGWDT